MVIITDLKKKEGKMKDIIAVPMVLIGFILAVMTSGFWIFVGFGLIIATILFGLFKKKKKFFDIKEILLFEYSLNSKSEKFNRIIKKYLDIK